MKRLVNQSLFAAPFRGNEESSTLQFAGLRPEVVAMLKPRSLLRGDITYNAAKDSDANILHELGYRDQKIRFFTYLYRNRELIKSLITSHLGLASRDLCHLVDVED